MVGVGNIDALHAPEHALRRVAPNNDVVARIIAALHPGEVGRHPGGVVAAGGVTARFLHGEGFHTHRAHLVDGLGLAAGFYDDFPDLLRGGFELHRQHDFLARRNNDVGKCTRLVADERYHERAPSHPHPRQAELAVGIGHSSGSFGRITEELHRRAGQGRLGIFVENPAPDGLGECLGEDSFSEKKRNRSV